MFPRFLIEKLVDTYGDKIYKDKTGDIEIGKR